MPGNFTAQMESCVHSVRTGTPPAVSGEDGMIALRILLAAYESAATGASVTVD
jgi:predicted dehydrogenase